jgi:hypothetical protein
MSNLWIMSEEKPRHKTIEFILKKFAHESALNLVCDEIQIIPLLDENHNFTFVYEIINWNCLEISKAYLKIVSGDSSFVDYLVYFQSLEPTPMDRPLMLIEETKTGDDESRNTGVYQRGTKFVYADFFYPKMNLTMFYNLHNPQKKSQSSTNVFGNRCLATLGIEIAGKVLDPIANRPFTSIEEMIDEKKKMRRPPKGNVPLTIQKKGNRLELTGRLIKNGTLSHDPNIGALTLISATSRKLGWDNEILVRSHGLDQSQVKPNNKFVRLANLLEIKLEGILLPKSSIASSYWHIDNAGEKNATIFLHVLVENFTSGRAIYENHGGAERGYFIAPNSKSIPIEKHIPGLTKKIPIEIPDLILLDQENQRILNIEGKTLENVNIGLSQLKNYDSVERLYIEKFYPAYEISRHLVIFGFRNDCKSIPEIVFSLGHDGKTYFNDAAPSLLRDAWESLLESQ